MDVNTQSGFILNIFDFLSLIVYYILWEVIILYGI
nr:MAG TPA: hypothetical protein [Caudoviricetes sp.]